MPRFMIKGHMIREATVAAHGKDEAEAERNAESGQFELMSQSGDGIFSVGEDSAVNLDTKKADADHRKPV